jgi:hypothetical protein
MLSLDELGKKHGTDKHEPHRYLPIYEHYLGPRRDAIKVLLEVGVGGWGDPHEGGPSLRMWADYLPWAVILGVDDQPKELDLPDDVHVYRGDQADAALFQSLRDKHGEFDVVVDDCSHHCQPTIATFKAVWPLISVGGLYICEDTGASYDIEYGGYPDPDSIPPTTRRPTTMQFFRRMADDVNFSTTWVGKDTNYPAHYWRGYRMTFVHFWQQLVVIQKAADHA